MKEPLGGLVPESRINRAATTVDWRPTVGAEAGIVLLPLAKAAGARGGCGTVSRPGRGEPLATSPGPSGDLLLQQPQSVGAKERGGGHWRNIVLGQFGVSCETLGVDPRTDLALEGPLMESFFGRNFKRALN